MLRISLVFLLLISTFLLNAQQHACKSGRADASALDPRSDSIDIIHTSIVLDMSNLPTPEVVGECSIIFMAKVNNINSITLDLLALEVDSVKNTNSQLAFIREGEKLIIELGQNLESTMQDTITVFYRGTPQDDASGFGGFSFSGGFAYNIGVGFLADPHNFGRVWFPCFDNFVERCTYSVEVISPENLTSYCGGIMTSDVVENGLRTRRWELNQEIPSYLASVAVAPFEELNYTYESLLYPELNVKLAAVAGDTQAVKNAFVSLEAIFHEFESHFGPYRWDRVGYVMVPFGAGAMEHATNIAYPRALLSSGAAGNQHIMAHELAHHWFGDLATCRTASEMWLNEGWASYTERLFDEWIINRETYDAEVRLNHKSMLQLCHVKDDGYWPLSNVPHEYTYSNSTYERPSDIIHSLRTYMGDSLFYTGLTDYLNEYSFKDANSNDLRDALEASTGLDLHSFFSDWVDTPGWGEFIVDSVEFLSFNTYRIHYSQNSVANEHTYTNVPFELSFRGENFELFAEDVMLSGPNGSVDVDVPFVPVFATLNRDEGISEAMTADERFVSTTGNQNWSNALIEVNTQEVSDSVLIRVEHHWVAPDPMRDPFSVYQLSNRRFWRVDGVLKDGFQASLKFTYNGRTQGTSSGWLDHELITSEENLYLMYRENPSKDWRVIDAIQQTFSSTADKFGNFTVDTLKLGEYTFAVIDSSLSIEDENLLSKEDDVQITIYPNPSKSAIQLNWTNVNPTSIGIFDVQGKHLGNIPVKGGETSAEVTISHLTPGNYLLRLCSKSNECFTKQFIKQ
ncbi:MAG: M1 family aminopeptidase [Bacteroidia bacterium]